MGRYDNDTERELTDGRRVFRSKLNPNVPLRDDDIYVVTQTGDRLDTIAAKYYNDASRWWILAAANKIHGADLGCKDGTVLRIPQNYIEIETKFNNQ